MAVKPKLQRIPEEEEAEERILAVQEGEEIITIDDDVEHKLLNMNPLGEVLSTICNYTSFVYFSILKLYNG